MLNPKSDIQAHGGVSLLIRMLACGYELAELILTIVVEREKVAEI